MSRILGISGSLRKGSYNSALLHAAAELRPGVVELGSIHGIPPYDADLEAAGVPATVIALKHQLAAADGLLLASPEYNNSVPGVLKNAIDWLSRPSEGLERVFRDKPVAVIGASPGGFGTVLAQNAWLPVLRSMGARHWSAGRLMVSAAGRVFDENGALTDDAVRQRLDHFIAGFEEFCAA